MNAGRSVTWVPSFLLGGAAALASYVAAVTLLYAGAGLHRSLTTILTVEAASFAVGLWGVPASEPGWVERLRYGWLSCMAAFLAATGFSVAWSLDDRLGEGGFGQGIGLALLAALPLYTCGGVLGGMTEAGRAGAGPGANGAAVSAGAAAGLAAGGALLPVLPAPAFLYVLSLAMISLAGMVFGSALDLD